MGKVEKGIGRFSGGSWGRKKQIGSQGDPVYRQALGQHFRHQRASAKQSGPQKDSESLMKGKTAIQRLVRAPGEDVRDDVHEKEFLYEVVGFVKGAHGPFQYGCEWPWEL